MAFISTATVKAIRTEIKKTLSTKDGFKLSVKNVDYSTVCVTVLQSPLQFSTSKATVNDYYLKDVENENEKLVFQIINKIVNRHTGGNYDRNAGDLGADYSDCNFYKDYQIGEWNKPCKFLN